tara:strand:+ start:224 stop:568 length:345 start_codon:yes stop_codon:yes gene_type:complete
MAITNTVIVDTALKHVVQSKGILDETDQIVANAEKLTSGTNESKLSLIECHFQIKGTGTLKISAESETDDLSFTGNGKYGLRPDQLRFGNDKIIKLTTDSNVKSYLLITEFRRS